MINVSKKYNCSGCHACYSVCPFGCIEMREDGEGFKYPYVDMSKCRQCGLCIKVCHKISPNKKENDMSKIIVGYNKNEDEVFESSSGGIFTLIAQAVIKEGGYVFGAAFNEDLILEHMCINSAEQLNKLQKSKYIQSNINDTFKQTKELLEQGKKVLYCGTPCQIAGLLKYVEKKENLITIDFICHGVPSQRSFKKYLEEIKDTYGKGRDVSKVDFRSKSTGWEEFSMKIEFDSGEAYEKVHKKDAFSKAFLGDIMLRPSCYECTEKGVNRISDITIADAWCIGDYDEKIYNKKGTSLIIVHSNNGYKMINEIGKYIEQKELSENFIKKTSPNTYYSAIVDRRRRKFMELMAAGETFESSVDIALQCDRRINIERKIRSKYKGIKRRIKKQ